MAGSRRGVDPLSRHRRSRRCLANSRNEGATAEFNQFARRPRQAVCVRRCNALVRFNFSSRRASPSRREALIRSLDASGVIKTITNSLCSTSSIPGEACVAARTGYTSSARFSATCYGGSARHRPVRRRQSPRSKPWTAPRAAPPSRRARDPPFHPPRSRATHHHPLPRTFCVMYRDMPMTPDSFCSVHSSVTCRRTSFFLLAATTTSAPRADAGRVTGATRSADVLAMLARAESMGVATCA